ncbi:MAG: insulinase family protein [Rhodobacteraceae bacterium]|nr:insulinase family protein [Paracoccaceae bacterium]
MGRFWAAFVVAVFLPPAALAETGRVSTFALPNGLQGVVIEDNRAPVVTHMLWYRAGAADEPVSKSGLAHFVEHLLFKGTRNLGPGAFDRIIRENGGQGNAFTSYDYTGYFQRVARDRLSLMMQLEADRMVNLVLDEEIVRIERDVVLEERTTRTDSDPGALLSEHRRAAQFMNHPYGLPIIGWRHEIEDLSLHDALDFYKTYYAPNNAILIVAGDVTPEEVKVLAEEYYGHLPRSETLPERVRPQEPPQISPRRLTYSDPRERQPYLVRSYLAPNRASGAQAGAAALTMLSYILGGTGVTSLLGEELQINRNTAVFSRAWYSGTSLDPDSFVIYAQPRPGVSLQELEDAIDAVIADLIANGFEAGKLDRLKARMRAEDIYKLDNHAGRARTYGRALTTGLTVEDVQSWPEILQAVTRKDIMAAAAKVFDINKSVTSWMVVDGWENSP